MTMPRINRHAAGFTALLALIAGLGLIGGTRFARMSESLDEGADASSLLSAVQRAPQETYGFAAPIQPAAPAKPDATNWAADEWRAAVSAVEKLRSTRNGQGMTPASASKIVWQPPEEISGKSRNEQESQPRK
ncbi:hypothetical protein OGR47_05055 [Methylocystis sp. MJC1]|jgi:hypothetical protein|uniref:hypothetical protein n=1 Tax=Methylocystis sp. MJC1 TaxID=2654282 RepID=UPI0013ECA149|nr:hypothetical protein [Methylocystis sp. MJC1]KAF2989733.1 hypothetical protein MJC1_03078 [Methylocystis sp. MJC1]MBU6526378.1 hypothetical protein [Methylocystis sp. MJC1]UZX12825.1 hypothetical protein OGR47_05055 [Methylocystis sp. MJC1]